MYKPLASVAVLVALFGGCTSTLPPSNRSGPDPSDPSAPEASAPRARESLVATTHVYLEPSAGQGAGTMDHSKMEGMQGMDHSKMPGMERKPPSAGTPSPQPEGMSGMDHSTMPGMGAPQPSAALSGKEALEMEMQKTSDEVKKLSDDLKAKSDSAKSVEGSDTKPQASTKSAAVIYTCPMHPQIKETEPGNCSICGMTLIKKPATPEGGKR